MKLPSDVLDNAGDSGGLTTPTACTPGPQSACYLLKLHASLQSDLAQVLATIHHFIVLSALHELIVQACLDDQLVKSAQYDEMVDCGEDLREVALERCVGTRSANGWLGLRTRWP